MDDKRAAESEIRSANDRFIATCAAATDAQWTFRPSSGWSMAEVAEHVAISNRNIGKLLAKGLLGSPIGDRRPGVSDVEIPYLFYRGDEPPNVGAPTGACGERRDAIVAVEESARAILAWSSGAHADLRSLGVEHPVFGLLDGVQWLLFVAAHTERHRAQLIGLGRAPGGR